MYLREKQDKRLLEIYVTDALKIISENTAKMVSEGVALNARYVDWVKQLKASKEPTESSETIINRIKDRINALGENTNELTESDGETDA